LAHGHEKKIPHSGVATVTVDGSEMAKTGFGAPGRLPAPWRPVVRRQDLA
jgi:hypothetical protein